MEYVHIPVLVREALDHLVVRRDGTYVDGTVGTGGHSLKIANNLGENGRLICLDRDPDAVELSKDRLAFLGRAIQLVQGNYADLDVLLRTLKVEKVDGILLDLGMSTYQLEKSGRGFSFQKNEPLDMRMDPNAEVSAGRLVNQLSSNELERILREFGEEKRARIVAKTIVKARVKSTIETSLQLAELIKSVFPRSRRPHTKHPATRTFQALRIAVNSELKNLQIFLGKAPSLLAEGGRLVILSYHSLEDRVVKRAMMGWEKGCICPPDFPYCVCGRKPLFRRISKKGIRPGRPEVEMNPSARSAVLRAAERLPS